MSARVENYLKAPKPARMNRPTKNSITVRIGHDVEQVVSSDPVQEIASMGALDTVQGMKGFVLVNKKGGVYVWGLSPEDLHELLHRGRFKRNKRYGKWMKR